MLIRYFKDCIVQNYNQRVQNCDLYLMMTITGIAIANIKNNKNVEA